MRKGTVKRDVARDDVGRRPEQPAVATVAVAAWIAGGARLPAAYEFSVLGQGSVPARHGAPGNPEVEVTIGGTPWRLSVTPDQIPAGRRAGFSVAPELQDSWFAVYDPAGRLILRIPPSHERQVPVSHVFDRSGAYTIRCVDACGSDALGSSLRLDVSR